VGRVAKGSQCLTLCISFHSVFDEPPYDDRADHLSANAHYDIWQGELRIAYKTRTKKERCRIERCGDGGGEEHPRGQLIFGEGEERIINKL